MLQCSEVGTIYKVYSKVKVEVKVKFTLEQARKA